MSKNLGQKLIIISGSPCVGKTTVADSLLNLCGNSAHLDDDWVWRVNPFLFDDPRNPNIMKNMSFVLSGYLNLNYDYVIVSSVRLLDQSNRDFVLENITAKDYSVISFMLTCTEKTLTERHRNRGDNNELSFKWLRLDPLPDDFVIETDNKTVPEIAKEIKDIIDKYTK